MASGPETVRIERHGPIGRVVLDRPQVRNAFDDTMVRNLLAAFASLAADRSVRAVVLTGEGSAFCAGADLEWMRRASGHEDTADLAGLLRAIYEFPTPVVCRVNGPAFGGGTGLIAACDLVVAADTAVFALSEVRVGLVPACISPYLLRRLGERWARIYFLTGARFTAAEAMTCGLVDRVVPAAGLDAAVDAYLDALLAAGPEALATCKEMIHRVSGMALDEAGPFTADLIARLRKGPEAQEGMAAFLERRPPKWAGARAEDREP